MISNEHLADWRRLHDAAFPTQRHRVDAMQARGAGLPVLGAVHDLCEQLERLAHEQQLVLAVDILELVLRRVLNVAVGEGQERLRIALADPNIIIPGTAAEVRILLERDRDK